MTHKGYGRGRRPNGFVLTAATLGGALGLSVGGYLGSQQPAELSMDYKPQSPAVSAEAASHKKPKVLKLKPGQVASVKGRRVKLIKKGANEGCFFLTYYEAYGVPEEDYDKGDGEFFCAK